MTWIAIAYKDVVRENVLSELLSECCRINSTQMDENQENDFKLFDCRTIYLSFIKEINKEYIYTSNLVCFS